MKSFLIMVAAVVVALVVYDQGMKVINRQKAKA